MTVYYVANDGNNAAAGDKDHPFRTIGKALEFLSGGDTLQVRGGTYKEAVEISTNNVTVVAYDGETPVIDCEYQLPLLPKTALAAAIKITGDSVVVSGLTVTRSAGIGISANDTTGTSILGCTITDCKRNAVFLLDSATFNISGCTIKRCDDSIDPSTPRRRSAVVELRRCSVGSVISSTIAESDGQGIGVVECANISIGTNTLYNNDGDMIYLDGVDTATIQRNAIFYTDSYPLKDRGYGINVSREIYPLKSGQTTADAVPNKNLYIKNNLVVSCDKSFVHSGGFSEVYNQDPGDQSSPITVPVPGYQWNNIVVAYNTFVNATRDGLKIRKEKDLFEYDTTGDTTCYLVNNIIYQVAGHSLQYSDENIGTYVLDGNIWYKAPRKFGELAALTGATNDIIADPKLSRPNAVIATADDFDPDNYKIRTTSDAVDAAITSHYAVTYDFYGTVRGVTPDIGFHEIVEGEEPVAEAEPLSTPVSGRTPLQADFEDQSTATRRLVDRVWAFGDGAISTEPNPSHVYTEEGTYDVRLITEDTKGLTSRAVITNAAQVTKDQGVTLAKVTRTYLPPSTSSTNVYHFLGDTPDLMFLMITGAMSVDVDESDATIGFGVCNGSLSQWGHGAKAVQGGATSDTDRAWHNLRAIMIPDGSGGTWRGQVTAVNNQYITITWDVGYVPTEGLFLVLGAVSGPGMVTHLAKASITNTVSHTNNSPGEPCSRGIVGPYFVYGGTAGSSSAYSFGLGFLSDGSDSAGFLTIKNNAVNPQSGLVASADSANSGIFFQSGAGLGGVNLQEEPLGMTLDMGYDPATLPAQTSFNYVTSPNSSKNALGDPSSVPPPTEVDTDHRWLPEGDPEITVGNEPVFHIGFMQNSKPIGGEDPPWYPTTASGPISIFMSDGVTTYTISNWHNMYRDGIAVKQRLSTGLFHYKDDGTVGFKGIFKHVRNAPGYRMSVVDLSVDPDSVWGVMGVGKHLSATGVRAGFALNTLNGYAGQTVFKVTDLSRHGTFADVTYSYTDGDGNTYTDPEPEIVYDNAGSFTLTQTITSFGTPSATDNYAVNININDAYLIPSFDIVYSKPSDTVATTGHGVSFVDTTVPIGGGSVVSWDWTLSRWVDGEPIVAAKSSASQFTAVIKYEGYYEISLKVVQDTGATGISSQDFEAEVKAPPVTLVNVIPLFGAIERFLPDRSGNIVEGPAPLCVEVENLSQLFGGEQKSVQWFYAPAIGELERLPGTNGKMLEPEILDIVARADEPVFSWGSGTVVSGVDNTVLTLPDPGYYFICCIVTTDGGMDFQYAPDLVRALSQQYALVGPSDPAAISATTRNDALGDSTHTHLVESTVTGEGMSLVRTDQLGRTRLEAVAVNTDMDNVSDSEDTVLALGGKLEFVGGTSGIRGDEVTMDIDSLIPEASGEVKIGSEKRRLDTVTTGTLNASELVPEGNVSAIDGSAFLGRSYRLLRNLTPESRIVYLDDASDIRLGDFLFFARDNTVELMHVVSNASTIVSGVNEWRVVVDRGAEIDTGYAASYWFAGDIAMNLGGYTTDNITESSAWIEMFADESITSRLLGDGLAEGPAIVGTIRTGAGPTDWRRFFAIGQLDGMYGIPEDTHTIGMCFGPEDDDRVFFRSDKTGIHFSHGTIGDFIRVSTNGLSVILDSTIQKSRSLGLESGTGRQLLTLDGTIDATSGDVNTFLHMQQEPGQQHSFRIKSRSHSGDEAIIEIVAADSLTASVDALIVLHGLPTADPVYAGALWNSAGTLKVSAG